MELLAKNDPWLEPYNDLIQKRREGFEKWLNSTSQSKLPDFAQGHHYFGIHFDKARELWTYREWAPEAHALFLTGEFCQWSREAWPLTKLDSGTWEVELPADQLKHGDLIKVHVVGSAGARDCIPAYIRRVVQDEETHDFTGQVWHAPDDEFQWTCPSPIEAGPLQGLKIYEAHVGMATEKQEVGSYRDFAREVLPRIAKGGFNAVQLMAIAEHPYYGSFGYHVANFFAPSSRCGTPEDLKFLIDEAHRLGLAVLMDVVHSHSVKNIAEGLAGFEVAGHSYFLEGDHPQWDSRLFDYGRDEVCHFLLSNLAYWMEEFHFDGFRFDGITSLLYQHHGNISFDHYDRYFDEGVNQEAILYLQAANELVHAIQANAITVAEDMSGMPGLCRPITEGGVGFDYRLAMGVPDFWIRLLKHQKDEDWKMSELVSTLANRRQGEATIAYAESHDQALVGDKTLAFWLMDAAMYEHMRCDDEHLDITRGIALHKLIRLVTYFLGGEGYLNFMGNEFGHPEWVDFPREGNDWSYQYARRQWSLVDKPELRYQQLGAFNQAMLESTEGLLVEEQTEILNTDDGNQCLQVRRGRWILVMNFSASKSIEHYRFPLGEVDPSATKAECILSSDDLQFGGYQNLPSGTTVPVADGQIALYLPARVGAIFCLKS